jgi:hypothetical protein
VRAAEASILLARGGRDIRRQKAFDSGNYEATKNTFEGLNQTGCPLN